MNKISDKTTHLNSTCKICDNDKDNTVYSAKEMMYGFRDEFHYFQCQQCECLQIGEFPENISKYYPENYYSFNEYDGKKFKGLSGSIKRKKYASLITGSKSKQRIMRMFSGNGNYTIFQGLDVDKNTKILDVGCGNGKSFLYPLAEIGFRNIRGCDPYLKKSLSYENGLQIDKSNLFDIKGQWKIITYHHSFEHVPDPKEQMKKVYELLEPGGVCILRVPTVSSYAWEHYRTNWAQLDAPRHYFLHSQKSMKMLGDLSNLELYKNSYDSTHFQFTGSEKYINDTALSKPRPKGLVNLIQRKMKKTQFKKKAKLLNKEGRGDQAAFFFRKKA